MGLYSKIGWTTHSANLWWGCVEVSPLCDNCYAREWAGRYARAKWGADQPRLAVKGVWAELARFQKLAAAAGRTDRVFVGSMMDIFERPMPLVDNTGNRLPGTTDDLRQRLFREVVPASPNLLFLLLTKRPGNIPSYTPPEWATHRPANVMFGASAGTQAEVDRDLPKLLAAPGETFLSMEPLLERVELPLLIDGGGDLSEAERRECGLPNAVIRSFGVLPPARLGWVIAGIESHGSRAGRFQDGYADAARHLRRQCRAAGVPFFNKQMPVNGRVVHDPAHFPADLRVQELPREAVTHV